MAGLTIATGLSTGLELTPSTGLSEGNGLSLVDIENAMYLYWGVDPMEWGVGNYFEWA